MLNPQFILPIAHELVVDLFCGGAEQRHQGLTP